MRFESHGAAVRLRYVTNMHNRKTPNKRTRRPKKGIRIRDLYTVNPTTSLLKLGCFWPWRMSTGSGLFSFLSSGFAQIFHQIVFIRLLKRNQEYKFGSVMAVLRCSKASLLEQSTGSTPQTKPLFVFIVKCWSSWRHHCGAISIRNASTAGSFHGRRPKTFSPHFRLDCWESIFSFSAKINRM